MKKIISLVLMVAMLLSGIAFAEELTLFGLFGNVHMGCPYDEVETLLGEYGSISTSSPLTRIGTAYDDNDINILRMRNITIAGIEESEVVFAFDENEKVYQCLYTFGTASVDTDSSLTEAEADSMYLATQTMLTNKYGIPEYEYFDEQSTYVLYSFADKLGVPFSNCVEMANSIEKSIIPNQTYCDKVSEWLVLQSNGDAILIDNFIGYTSMNGRSYQTYILYTYIPAEVLNQEDNTNDWL